MRNSLLKWGQAALVGMVFHCVCLGQELSALRISEIMASNSKTLTDEDGDYSDWIEIFNSGGSVANLEGWFLTDSTNQLNRWTFPAVTLPAKGYLVVFASGKNRAATSGKLHTNFSLNADGEYLALVAPDGQTVASEYEPEYPQQRADYSYGEYLGTNYYFGKPSPGSPNQPGFVAFVEDTQFSVDRGFYDKPFDLEIACTTPGAEIRYTTNGALPALTNGLVYAHAIPVTATMCVRAAAFKSGYQPSNVDTHTYFFLEDVIRQSPTGKAPAGWPASWGGNTVDYGMDPDVVNKPAYSGIIKDALKSLPSFSIVMDLKDLFDSSRGIYANPGQDGRSWERPTSVELIYPDGQKGFHANAGIRIRGGFSRSTGNPKHAFRLFFREEYGVDKLKYPLFGDDGTDTFDCFDLRTFQNYSWSFQGDSRGIFIRDQLNRDLQLAMGSQGERGNYYHLYINGQYWGLYNTCERPEASFAETYYGGSKENYDVIKVEAGSYNVNATDGNMTAWTQLYNMGKSGFAAAAAYQKVQGNNPDGTRNPAYPNLVDIDNLIDYMLIIFYGGNLDAPISDFLGNMQPNNWYGMRDRTGNDGFRFLVHDAEHTLLNVNENRTGPYSAGDSSVVYSSPQWIFQKLMANLEFRLRVADHVQKHFFNGGVLTPSVARSLFMKRKDQIELAVVAESARWGDAKRSTPFTRDVEWRAAVNNILNNYLPQRTDIVLNQLKVKSLYPTLAAPAYSQHGGNVEGGYALSISAPVGTLYYTLDGTDPRLAGGAVAPSARQYQGPLNVVQSLTLKSRALLGTNWSALNEAQFTVIQRFKELVVSEIMYRPPNQNGVDGDNYEFIELKNIGKEVLDLSGVRFTNGIVYAFPVGSSLAPGRHIVLVSNLESFTNRYPEVNPDGVYGGKLANNGDTIALVHAAGMVICNFAYDVNIPWPASADGGGHSLVLIQPDLNPDPANPANWRASTEVGGSPGHDDPISNIARVVLNEVMPDFPEFPAGTIELHNPDAQSAEIGGWFLSTDLAKPRMLQLPSGLRIEPGGYLAVAADQLISQDGVPLRLPSTGGELFLFSADSQGNLTGYEDEFRYDAPPINHSLGRYTNSVGDVLYPAQTRPTLGELNSGPLVGPVVINEIYADPSPGTMAFVELKNISQAPILLSDNASGTNSWKLDGIGASLPPETTIPAGGMIVLTSGDPAQFRLRNPMPANVLVLGPYSGTLQHNGERLQLVRPEERTVVEEALISGLRITNNVVTWVVVDTVTYRDRAPWPVGVAGLSLERIAPFGDDPNSWRSSFMPPSPGLENSGNRSPQVSAGGDIDITTIGFPLSTNLVAVTIDDGYPKPPGKLAVIWQQTGGPSRANLSSTNQPSISISLPGAGLYTFRVTASDGELASSDEVTVQARVANMPATLVAAGSVWRYLDDGSNQQTAWQKPGFDDSQWKSGPAQLGYNDGDEKTVVGFGPSSSSKYITTYFRHTFMVANAAFVSQLKARLLRDDGAVVYLNGREIFRSNMPEQEILFSTTASQVISGDEETSVFVENEVDPSLLQTGANILAVEIHQQSGSSTDISFDFALESMIQPVNLAPIVNAGPDVKTGLSDILLLEGDIADDGLPASPGAVTCQWTQINGPGLAKFEHPEKPASGVTFDKDGVYVLRLSADDGIARSWDETSITVESSGIDAWKAKYFTATELLDEAIAGEGADPDGDGFNNASEFLAGTDPRDGSSYLRLEVRSSVVRKLAFHAVQGKTYSIFYRKALQDVRWEKWRDVDAVGQSGEIELEDATTSETRFYRLATPAVR